jgi:nitrogen fixation/metabolism regulation signal transduction histidine kinase
MTAVFFTATGLLQRSIDRWFSTPVREVVSRARAVEDMAEKRLVEAVVEDARALGRLPEGPETQALRLAAFLRTQRLDSVEVYRAGRRIAAAASDSTRLPLLPEETLRAARSAGEAVKVEVLPDGSQRFRAATRSGSRIVAAGIRIPPEEARAMQAIATAWSEYQKLEVQKPAIKAASISTFLLITLVFLFASIWVGLTLARRITVPIAALAESTRRIRSGDLAARVDAQASDELGVLVDSFNDMAAGLEGARGALLRSNDELQAFNQRLEHERRLLATVLESVTTGVLAIDAEGRVSVCNPAARSLLRLPEGEVTIESLRRPELGAWPMRSRTPSPRSASPRSESPSASAPEAPTWPKRSSEARASSSRK